MNALRPHRSSAREKIAACLLAMLFAMLPGPGRDVAAQTRNPAPLQFNDLAEQERFQRLTAELRCVMCQNQSLADSNAQIANDLRREVLDLMRDGKTDAQVKQFLVERYGDFVLYRPQVSSSTWLLWFGPGALLLVGALVLWRIVVSRSRAVVPADDGQEW